MRVIVTGIPQAQARIRRIMGSLAAAAGPSAQAGAEVLAEGAQERAPVATGELQGSIGVADAGGDSADVVATAGHAIYQEHGTSVMAAQPFMRPAADEEGSAVQAAMTPPLRAAVAL